MLGYVLEIGETYQVYRDETPEETYKKVYTFNSSRKSMTTVIPFNGGYRVFTKGASEMVLSKCSTIIGRNGLKSNFGENDQQDVIKNVIDPMASNGLRTIAVAYKDFIAEEGNAYFTAVRLIIYIYLENVFQGILCSGTLFMPFCRG